MVNQSNRDTVLNAEQIRFISFVWGYVTFDHMKYALDNFNRVAARQASWNEKFSTETIASIARSHIEVPFGLQTAMTKQDEEFAKLDTLHQFHIIQAASSLAMDLIEEYLWMWEDGRD
jgi:hypothetical protein